MYVGFSNRIKSLGSMRIGTGWRLSQRTWYVAFGLCLVVFLWFIIKLCAFIIYWICRGIFLGCRAIFRKITGKKPADAGVESK